MVVVPVATPVTLPDADTVAFAGVELLHTPPAGALANDILPPTHTLLKPEISAGTGFTVITLVR
jgi:hypothetical protein